MLYGNLELAKAHHEELLRDAQPYLIDGLKSPAKLPTGPRQHPIVRYLITGLVSLLIVFGFFI